MLVELGRQLFAAQAAPLSARAPLGVAVAERLLPGPAGQLHARLYTPA